MVAVVALGCCNNLKYRRYHEDKEPRAIYGYRLGLCLSDIKLCLKECSTMRFAPEERDPWDERNDL